MADAPDSHRRCFHLTPDRCVVGLLAVEGLLWLSKWFQLSPKGWPVLIALATVGAAMLLMLLWFAVALLFRWRFQFSIRALLLAMLAVALPLGWLTTEMKQAREQQEVVEEIESAVEHIANSGRPVSYDWQYDADGKALPNAQPPERGWPWNMLGGDFFDSVRVLSFSGSHATDAALDDLESLHEPHNYGRGTPNIIARLKRLNGVSQLKELWLEDTDITDAGLQQLKGLTQLEKLSLSGTEVTDAGLVNLQGLRKLRELGLGETGVTDSGLDRLLGLSGLRDLWLDSNEVTDTGLAHLEGLRKLQSLDLAFTQVTDAGLAHLEGLAQLRRLELGATPITGAGLRHLRGLRQLQGLWLENTEVADSGLANVESLTQLQTLDLSFTLVTDAGLAHLERLTYLRRLRLGGTPITDAGLRYLTGLRDLQELVLNNTKVTRAGVKEIEQALPNCQVMSFFPAP
jgi:hypothetical protein